jgi:hypothetical protein
MGRQTTQPEFYEPELLGALQEIFDLAWQQIIATPGYSLNEKSAEQRRRDLSQMIILAYRSGMQPEEIKAFILEDIACSNARAKPATCLRRTPKQLVASLTPREK